MQGSILAKASITLVRVNDGATGNGVVKTEVYYYLSTSNTEQAGGSWVITPPSWISGRYYWQKIKTTYTDNTISESKPICISGAKGDAGESGKGITSITIEFYLSTSKTGQVGGSWTTVMPTWSSGKYLWTRNKIAYNNPYSIEYTTPICDSSWEAINDIEIGARNILLKSKGPFSNANFKIGSWNFGEVSPVENMTYTCTIEGSLGEGKTDFMLMNSSVPGGFGKLKFVGNGVYSLTFKWPHEATAKDGVYINILPELTVVNSTIKWIKLEKGNKATDWTPAPEDVTEDIDGVKDDLHNNYYSKTETNSQIDIASDSITQEVSKTYTTKKEFNELEVGGRNYIHQGRGNLKAGFFESFDQVTDDYSECTLTSNGTYATVDLSNGFVLGCRDYNVGRKIVFSYDIMYTKWDFPVGTDRKYFWIGQRYTRASDSSITDGQYTKVTSHVLPEVGINGCELHKWFHVEEVLTIPNQAAIGIEEEAKIVFHNSNASVSASVTFRMKNVKIEYGNRGSDWSPSPEDMENSMAEIESTIQESITQQSTNIQSTCENIILEALNSYTKTQDLELFKETVSAQLKLLSDQMTLQFNQTSQEIVDINGELQEKFDTITKYFTFDIDGLTIGQIDSPYKVIVNNDRYSMTVNDIEVMWIANGKVYTPEIEVTRAFKLFGYTIDQDQNGNINMEYVGG